MKDFDVWMHKKKKIEKRRPISFVHEREVWWCSLGVNIGSEQDGKNEKFERPVLVLKRFSADVVLVIPFTSQLRDNIYQYQFIKENITWALWLSQIRLVSTKRFSYKIRKIDKVLFEEIKWQIVKVVF